MKSTIEQLDKNQVKINIDVPESEFQADIDKAFKTIAHQVNIPGFRKGKAPRQILERKFGQEVGRQQAIQDSASKYYALALSEHNLEPIAQPDLNVLNGETEGDFQFDITVKVKPEIQVEGYSKLEVEVDVPPVTDDQIQEQVDQFLSQYATFEKKSGALKEGDVAVISIEAEIDGEEVPGLNTDEFQYEIGTKVISDKFDEELVGKKTGDKLELKAPLSERFNENAGLEVDFKVEVNEVKKKVLPELTDEWVKEKTSNETVAEFKKGLKDQLEQVRVNQAQSQLQTNVFESLADLVQDEVPNEMVEIEKQNRINQMNQQFAQMGFSYEQFLEMADEEIKKQNQEELQKQAEIAAKSDLALTYIVKKEGLEADENDLDDVINHEAEHAKVKPAKLKKQLEDNSMLDDLKRDVAKRKAIEFIIENATAFDKEGNAIVLDQSSDKSGSGDSVAGDSVVAEASEGDSKVDNEAKKTSQKAKSKSDKTKK